MNRLLGGILFVFVAYPAFGFDLTVVSYNLESGGDTDRSSVVQDLQRIPASHIWGLVEVKSADFESFRAAIGPDFKIVAGDTGGGDRMAIVYDTNVLEKVGNKQQLSDAGGSRHPLLAEFRIKGTTKKFMFIVNHLQRDLGAPTSERRQAQASWLNSWAQKRAGEDNPPAVILVGDYNFDVTPYTKRGNPAFDIFMYNGMFRWVEPACLSDQFCPVTGTGCNTDYNSILDFVFLAGSARKWFAQSEILFRDDADYCKNEKSGGSDHRPVRAILTFENGNE